MRFRYWIAVAALLALSACAAPLSCDAERDGGIGGTGIDNQVCAPTPPAL
jgi:hypothetical protein